MPSITRKDSRNDIISLFQELPYNNVNILECHGQFNNSIATNLPTKKELDKLCSIYDLDLFNLNTNTNINPDCIIYHLNLYAAIITLLIVFREQKVLIRFPVNAFHFFITT
jgi:hypothetical protein